MDRLPKKIVILALVMLGLATLLVAAPSRAQEIPQPISRPCKHPCPNKIKFANAPRLDSIELHARIVPISSIDPASEPVTVELSDPNGVLFTATLNPGDIKTTNGGKRWLYRNPAAKTAGGIYRLSIAPRHDVNEGYRVDVLAYGDLSAATDPNISTFIVVGGDSFFDNGPWTPHKNGWMRDFTP
jgi:hypothetical protein